MIGTISMIYHGIIETIIGTYFGSDGIKEIAACTYLLVSQVTTIVDGTECLFASA
jgi:hypothetical protein